MNEKIHQPITITPNLFQLGVPSFPVYLSMGEEGMIIEGGTGPTSDIIVKQLDMLGIDPSKIKYMALTHTHGDHVGAVPRLRELWPHIKVVAGPVAAKFLGKDSFVKRFLPMDDMISEILIDRGDIEKPPSRLDEYRFEADMIVGEGDTIDLGAGIVWQVYSSTGHSPCHISFFEQKERTLTIGDMTGYFDPERDVFWPNYFASLPEYCDSIRKMAAIPSARGILSHNGVIEGNTKKHMEKAIKATEAYHNEVLGRLDQGEDEKKLNTEKADWVTSLGALASYETIVALCGLLVNNSKAERDKKLFSFP